MDLFAHVQKIKYAIIFIFAIAASTCTSQQHPMADSALALKIPEALQPKMAQVHEDIMILQSLIDD